VAIYFALFDESSEIHNMPKKIGAIVLAAGKSQRMGRPKILLPVQGIAMIHRVLQALKQANIQDIAIVLGHEYQNAVLYLNLLEEARTADILINRTYEQGMATSLQIGALAIAADWDGFFVLLADMPWITAKVILAEAAAFETACDNAIVIPQYQGKRGHPVLFSSQYALELHKLEGDQGARSLIQKYANNIVWFTTDSESICIDIDTEDQLRTWNQIKSL